MSFIQIDRKMFYDRETVFKIGAESLTIYSLLLSKRGLNSFVDFTIKGLISFTDREVKTNTVLKYPDKDRNVPKLKSLKVYRKYLKVLIDNGITETCYTDGQTEKDVLEHVQGCLLGMVAGAWLNAITREYSPSENAFSSLVWNIPFTWEPDDGIELALALANSKKKEKMLKKQNHETVEEIPPML